MIDPDYLVPGSHINGGGLTSLSVSVSGNPLDLCMLEEMNVNSFALPDGLGITLEGCS